MHLLALRKIGDRLAFAAVQVDQRCGLQAEGKTLFTVRDGTVIKHRIHTVQALHRFA